LLVVAAKIVKIRMLSSFFNSSKPIHHVIFIIMLGAALLTLGLKMLVNVDFQVISWIFTVLMMAGLYHFIVIRNELTRSHSYASLVFVSLTIGLLPFIFLETNIFSLLFILLGLRRLMSMRSGLAMVRKIFDAAFFLTCAALLTSGGIWLLVLVFLAILFYAPSDYRHWLVPFVGSSCALVLILVVDLYIYELPVRRLFKIIDTSLSWSTWENWLVYLVPGLVLFLCIGSILNYLAGLLNMQQRVLPRFTLLAIYTLIVMVFLVIKGSDDVMASCILLLPIAALFLAQIIDRIERVIYKELLIAIPLIIGMVSFMLGWGSI
jgi:hypothetical protein